jgi:hypothetical protein
MNTVLLLVGLFVLWIWLHGHPIGALGAFVALVLSGLVPQTHGALSFLGISAGIALMPMMVLWFFRDIRKGRAGLLAQAGTWYLAEMRTPSKPHWSARKPAPIVDPLEGYSWSKADLEAWARRKSMEELHEYEKATGQLFEQPLGVRLRQPGD